MRRGREATGDGRRLDLLRGGGQYRRGWVARLAVKDRIRPGLCRRMLLLIADIPSTKHPRGKRRQPRGRQAEESPELCLLQHLARRKRRGREEQRHSESNRRRQSNHDQVAIVQTRREAQAARGCRQTRQRDPQGLAEKDRPEDNPCPYAGASKRNTRVDQREKKQNPFYRELPPPLKLVQSVARAIRRVDVDPGITRGVGQPRQDRNQSERRVKASHV